jgi:carbon monoxide dehydrogenase subunit G
MQLCGDEPFSQSPDEVWRCLTDMQFMSVVIPDIDRVESIEQTGFVCRVRPRFSFFSGKVKLSFQLTSQEPPDKLKVEVHGKGIGGAILVEIGIRLEPTHEGTVVHWNGEIVKREGLFRPVGESLVAGAAGRIVDGLWSGFRHALAENSVNSGNEMEE